MNQIKNFILYLISIKFAENFICKTLKMRINLV